MSAKIGILSSHPVQYLSPIYRELAKVVQLQVFYAHKQTRQGQSDAGFGVAFEWDIDLLAGYSHEFLCNESNSPDVNRFTGCDTPDIWNKVKTGNFDLFIVTGWYLKCYWQATRACRHFGVPILVRGDSQLQSPRSLLKKVGKEIAYRILMKQFTGFLAVGERNREYLLHYGVSKERIFFSPHCVDNEWFSNLAQRLDPAETKKLIGCDTHQTIVLFVGKLIPRKRPRDLLRALSILKQREPRMGVQALFVGSGEMQQELREESARLNIQAVFAGFKNQTELPPIYFAADVLVLPSDGSETWGLVVNEAMACGTPAIVSSAVGCAPDLIEDEQTGAVYAVGDEEKLASALRRIIPTARSPDVKRALKAKTAEYSITNAINGILEATERLSWTPMCF